MGEYLSHVYPRQQENIVEGPTQDFLKRGGGGGSWSSQRQGRMKKRTFLVFSKIKNNKVRGGGVLTPVLYLKEYFLKHELAFHLSDSVHGL